MPSRTFTVPLLLLCIIAFIVFQKSVVNGEQSFDASSWEGTEWVNLPAGKTSLDISDFKGRVVYLAFFQKW